MTGKWEKVKKGCWERNKGRKTERKGKIGRERIGKKDRRMEDEDAEDGGRKK